jgi:hypothetical protein
MAVRFGHRAQRLVLIVIGMGLLSASILAAAGAQTPPPGTPAGAPAAVTPVQPTAGENRQAAPIETPTVNAKRAEECDRLIAVLSGQNKDDKLLKSPQLQKLAQESRDLATCGAVASDSPALCKAAGETDAHNGCLLMQATFQELRAHPKGGRLFFTTGSYEHCRTEITPLICEKLRDAVAANDASKCGWKPGEKPEAIPADPRHHPKALSAAEVRTDFPVMCRALVTLDKSLCSQIKDPDTKHVCADVIERNAVYATGLKAMAESAPQPQRNLAKAALGQADACESYADTARKACLGTGPVGASGTPAAATGASPAATPQ